MKTKPTSGVRSPLGEVQPTTRDTSPQMLALLSRMEDGVLEILSFDRHTPEEREAWEGVAKAAREKKEELESLTQKRDAAKILEAVLQGVLHDSTITPEDRDALEKAVFIARNLQRKPQGGGR